MHEVVSDWHNSAYICAHTLYIIYTPHAHTHVSMTDSCTGSCLINFYI